MGRHLHELSYLNFIPVSIVLIPEVVHCKSHRHCEQHLHTIMHLTSAQLGKLHKGEHVVNEDLGITRHS
jgi:hypothetical protein